MNKTKFCSFALACIIGCTSISPLYAYAAETNTESVTLSESSKSQKDRHAAFDAAMKKATEKWNTLSEIQKAEIYALIEDEMKSEIRLMDKLVELDIISKSDGSAFNARLLERFKKMKDSGEFPLTRNKPSKKQ